MGMIGKGGVVVAGGIPLAFAAVEAIAPWTDPAWGALGLSTKLKGSLGTFTNTLTSGFGLGTAVSPTAVLQGEALTPAPAVTAAISGGNYAGAWYKTTAAGIGLVVIDGVIGVVTRFGAGGRVRPKIMGRQLISG